jgi:large subunit ribosomal protein L9
MRQAENLRKQAVVRRAEKEKEYGQIADQIRGLQLYFPVRAGETGKLYGSVTAGDIAEQIKALVGLEIDRRRIGDRPLRELGEFNVPIRLDAGLAPVVKVIVFREGHDPRTQEVMAEEPVVEEALPVEEAPSMEAEPSAEQAAE